MKCGLTAVADRIKFKVVRVVTKTQVCECAVDVDDPFDTENISNKLKAKDFVEFVVLDEEIMEDDNWSFQPILNS